MLVVLEIRYYTIIIPAEAIVYDCLGTAKVVIDDNIRTIKVQFSYVSLRHVFSNIFLLFSNIRYLSACKEAHHIYSTASDALQAN